MRWCLCSLIVYMALCHGSVAGVLNGDIQRTTLQVTATYARLLAGSIVRNLIGEAKADSAAWIRS